MIRCLPLVLMVLATVPCGDRFAVSDDDDNNHWAIGVFLECH